ncbi:type I-E CRISPR-associated protein Cas7/Cse4/CasC [Nocardiopsis sp. CNT-189]|uniref:type I-E CRISPR-associated protein Cas7/Cse4/CasC n=1 Tax=Nocardiopsis oceanisediminis TaxID=2816862 RepID=UPI003B363584
MVFLDVHAIQSVPPANINRDENGSPKTALYGGARRLRVSSQAWKRAARKELERASAGFQESQRTKRLPEKLEAEITALAPHLADRAGEIAETAVKELFKVKTKAGKNGKRPTTEYLLFLGDEQRRRVAELLVGAEEKVLGAVGDAKRFEKAAKELGLREAIDGGHPPAVALFGRMIATDPELNVDAACQVAHAISTHAVEAQFDYYTAVDDAAQDADETGAGMIGSIEFNAATMYRYAAVDLESLVRNLDGDRGFAAEAATAFARAFLLSMPTGKRTTFANNTRPDYVLLSIRDDQPVSLAGAFERPVTAENDDGDLLGYTARSVRRLVDYHAAQDEQYGSAPDTVATASPDWVAEAVGGGLRVPAEPVPLPKALDRVRGRLAELIGGGDG